MLSNNDLLLTIINHLAIIAFFKQNQIILKLIKIKIKKELKQAFAPYNYLLTAAVGAGKSTIDSAYEVSEIAK